MAKMSEVERKASQARGAARQSALLSSAVKDRVLRAMAAALRKNTAAILKSNTLDVRLAKRNNMSEAMLDRLLLNESRVISMANGLLALTKLPDPNGQILARFKRPNGLLIEKISVPMGVIAMIYESRPNVTADAAGLCFKAGSAVILRGGSDAANSNKCIAGILRGVLRAHKLPEDIIQIIENTDRAAVAELMILRQYIDLLIPRGGAGLIQRVIAESKIPVIETGTGNCHVFVDAGADINQACAIVLNAKTRRPSVCNAAESLLAHKDIAKKFLPKMLAALTAAGVKIHGCAQTRKYAKNILPASEADFAKEYLALEISIKVVKDVAEAVAHINRYGTRHTETIVTKNKKNAEKFLREVDAASVMVNASTGFSDGGEFGFGCEIGISTQKLHARGPMALREIMSYKYLVRGSGQVRKP